MPVESGCTVFLVVFLPTLAFDNVMVICYLRSNSPKHAVSENGCSVSNDCICSTLNPKDQEEPDSSAPRAFRCVQSLLSIVILAGVLYLVSIRDAIMAGFSPDISHSQSKCGLLRSLPWELPWVPLMTREAG